MVIFVIVVLVLLQTRTSTQLARKSPVDYCPFDNVSISVFIDPPYANTNSSGIITELIVNAFRTCFQTKTCTQRKINRIQWKVIQSEDDLVREIKKKRTNIAFPVPPSRAPSLVYKSNRLTVKRQVEYFSVASTPGPALIVNYHACKNIANSLLSETVSSVWPILVLSLLLAGISGVCIWAMEHRNNNEQFAKPFVRGAYDGCWWALVSMTTVGYGNQVPHSLVGRLFGMVWILAGVTIIAVFTASISSAITVVSVKQYCSGLQGQTIAVLNNSEAEAIARHHGAIVTAYNDVKPMFADLKSQHLKGILMDRLKAYYYLNKIKDERLRISQVLAKKMEYSVAMVEGNVTQALKANDCFMDILENPRSKIYRIMKRYIHPVKPLASTNETIGLFSSDSVVMRSTLIALAAVFTLLLVCGLVWERLYRHQNCFRPTTVPNNVLTNEDISMDTRNHNNDQIIQLQAAITELAEQIRDLRCKLKDAEGRSVEDSKI